MLEGIKCLQSNKVNQKFSAKISQIHSKSKTLKSSKAHHIKKVNFLKFCDFIAVSLNMADLIDRSS